MKRLNIEEKAIVVGIALALTGSALPAYSQTGSRFVLEEIIVTARKRDETLSDVPVTLSVFSGDTLEEKRITQIGGLIAKAPGLFLSQNQTFGPVKSETYITMRGVGATTPLEPAVAVFVDGVYQPKLAFDIFFLELERVEILRGPQGTLFGRNAQGGAMSLITKKPTNELSGNVTVDLDEYDSYGIKGTVNVPLIEDKLYWSLSGAYSQTDGFIRNRTLDRDQADQEKAGWRSTLLAHINEDFTATFTLNGSELSGGQVGAGVPTGSRKYDVFDNDVRDIQDDAFGGSLTLDWVVGDVAVTSITGYSKVETDVFFDLDGSAIGTGNFQNQVFEQTYTSQEFRVASSFDDSNWDWLTGVYYFDSTYDQARNFSLLDPSSTPGVPVLNPGNSVTENADFERDGWAVFGQLNYQLNESWEFTVGGRYASENVEARQFGHVILVGVGVDSPYDNTADQTFNGFSPMTSLSYKPNEDVMVYGTISHGFKAGGFPKYPFSQDRTGIPFDEEVSVNYELGIKSSWFDNKLALNAAIYHITIEDQQLGSQVDGPAGVPVEGIDNVGESTNDGAELEITWLPTDGLKLFANLGFIDAKFDEYVDENGTDRASEAVPYIPEFTANVGLQYVHDVSSALSLTWAVDYSYVDDYIVGNGVGTFDPRIPIDDVDYWDVSATLRHENWDLTLYADNATNEFNVLRTWQSPFHDPSQFSFDTVLPPRTVGLKASYRF
jgi:iron complex outermembrane receptor protein